MLKTRVVDLMSCNAPGISFYISQSEVIKLFIPNMYRDIVLIDGDMDFVYSKNNYKRLFYRIKNAVEVATLCHYDIWLLRQTTVETCCLLERLRSAEDHISFTLDMEDYYRIKDTEKKTDE